MKFTKVWRFWRWRRGHELKCFCRIFEHNRFTKQHIWFMDQPVKGIKTKKKKIKNNTKKCWASIAFRLQPHRHITLLQQLVFVSCSAHTLSIQQNKFTLLYRPNWQLFQPHNDCRIVKAIHNFHIISSFFFFFISSQIQPDYRWISFDFFVFVPVFEILICQSVVAINLCLIHPN